MFKQLLTLTLLLTVSFTVACTEREVGTKKRPLQFYFLPAIDAHQLSVAGKSLEKYLSRHLSQELYGKDKGFYVESAVPTSYLTVAEAFGTKKADLAAFNVFGYILAKDIKKYPVKAIFTVKRSDGKTYYQSQIVAHVDSGIKNLNDLNGKKFAFSDVASTSGYIVPSKMLKDAGIKLSDRVFANRHDNVITMVYNKQVDAGSTYYSSPVEEVVNGKKVTRYRDARDRVATQYPDVFEKVKIIKISQHIPNEPWVLRTNLFKDPVKNERVTKAIIKALVN